MGRLLGRGAFGKASEGGAGQELSTYRAIYGLIGLYRGLWGLYRGLWGYIGVYRLII